MTRTERLIYNRAVNTGAATLGQFEQYAVDCRVRRETARRAVDGLVRNGHLELAGPWVDGNGQTVELYRAVTTMDEWLRRRA